jgi:hypothetical protein
MTGGGDRERRQAPGPAWRRRLRGRRSRDSCWPRSRDSSSGHRPEYIQCCSEAACPDNSASAASAQERDETRPHPRPPPHGRLVTGCVTRVQLNPEFAARARELPMEVADGFPMPRQFRIGSYSVKRIVFKQLGPPCIPLTNICSGGYSPWRFMAEVEAPGEPPRSFVCNASLSEGSGGERPRQPGQTFPMDCTSLAKSR